MAERDEPVWIKSPFCNGGNVCVEVASLPDGQVGLRNSRDLAAVPQVFTRAEWDAFLTGMKDGAFDHI